MACTCIPAGTDRDYWQGSLCEECEQRMEDREAIDRLEAFDAGPDECPHCGAGAFESADCAMNGCPFGLQSEGIANSLTARSE